MRSTLIIDADDTLWENNIHFEEATERFLDILESRGGERESARDRLTQIEKRNVPIHGYGCGGYSRSLMDILEEIEGKPASSSDRARILSLAQRVRRMPIQYLPGVKETLPLLRQRHRLILSTKESSTSSATRWRAAVWKFFFTRSRSQVRKRPKTTIVSWNGMPSCGMRAGW